VRDEFARPEFSAEVSSLNNREREGIFIYLCDGSASEYMDISALENSPIPVRITGVLSWQVGV
jgi:hypothetical protein